MASEKVTKLIEDVKALTVLELSDLVKALEEEFGVSAAAPVAVAAAPAAGAAAPAAEEKTEFDVVPRSARRRSRLLRLSVRSRAWALSTRRLLSTAHRRLSRKASPRRTPRLPRRSWKRLAQRSSSSKFFAQRHALPCGERAFFTPKRNFFFPTGTGINFVGKFLLFQPFLVKTDY